MPAGRPGDYRRGPAQVHLTPMGSGLAVEETIDLYVGKGEQILQWIGYTACSRLAFKRGGWAGRTPCCGRIRAWGQAHAQSARAMRALDAWFAHCASARMYAANPHGSAVGHFQRQEG